MQHLCSSWAEAAAAASSEYAIITSAGERKPRSNTNWGVVARAINPIEILSKSRYVSIKRIPSMHGQRHGVLLAKHLGLHMDCFRQVRVFLFCSACLCVLCFLFALFFFFLFCVIFCFSLANDATHAKPAQAYFFVLHSLWEFLRKERDFLDKRKYSWVLYKNTRGLL